MSLPGFVSEVSIYKARGHYYSPQYSAIDSGLTADLEPQSRPLTPQEREECARAGDACLRECQRAAVDCFTSCPIVPPDYGVQCSKYCADADDACEAACLGFRCQRGERGGDPQRHKRCQQNLIHHLGVECPAYDFREDCDACVQSALEACATCEGPTGDRRQCRERDRTARQDCVQKPFGRLLDQDCFDECFAECRRHPPIGVAIDECEMVCVDPCWVAVG